MAANLGAELWENGEPVYLRMKADDPNLFKWIPCSSKNFQLLHHVAICNCNCGLILVGNDCKIMFGIFVEYSQALHDAYLEVLVDLYNGALIWAYGPVEEIPKSNISAALHGDAMKKAKSLSTCFSPPSLSGGNF